MHFLKTRSPLLSSGPSLAHFPEEKRTFAQLLRNHNLFNCLQLLARNLCKLIGIGKPTGLYHFSARKMDEWHPHSSRYRREQRCAMDVKRKTSLQLAACVAIIVVVTKSTNQQVAPPPGRYEDSKEVQPSCMHKVTI